MLMHAAYFLDPTGQLFVATEKVTLSFMVVPKTTLCLYHVSAFTVYTEVPLGETFPKTRETAFAQVLAGYNLRQLATLDAFPVYIFETRRGKESVLPGSIMPSHLTEGLATYYCIQARDIEPDTILHGPCLQLMQTIHGYISVEGNQFLGDWLTAARTHCTQKDAFDIDGFFGTDLHFLYSPVDRLRLAYVYWGESALCAVPWFYHKRKWLDSKRRYVEIVVEALQDVLAPHDIRCALRETEDMHLLAPDALLQYY